MGKISKSRVKENPGNPIPSFFTVSSNRDDNVYNARLPRPEVFAKTWSYPAQTPGTCYGQNRFRLISGWSG